MKFSPSRRLLFRRHPQLQDLFCLHSPTNIVAKSSFTHKVACKASWSLLLPSFVEHREFLAAAIRPSAHHVRFIDWRSSRSPKWLLCWLSACIAKSKAESKRWCNFLPNALGHDSTLKILRALPEVSFGFFFCERMIVVVLGWITFFLLLCFNTIFGLRRVHHVDFVVVCLTLDTFSLTLGSGSRFLSLYSVFIQFTQ